MTKPNVPKPRNKQQMTDGVLDLSGPLSGEGKEIPRAVIDGARTALAWSLGRYGDVTIEQALLGITEEGTAIRESEQPPEPAAPTEPPEPAA